MKRKRPWWVWVLLAIVALMVVGAIFGEEPNDDDTAGGPVQEQTTTVPPDDEAPATTTTATVPAQAFADAREAVDDDEYPAALAIAATLTASEANAIRRRIANRLGKRAIAAVRSDQRGVARRYIIAAQEYPNTLFTRQARSSYKAAKARAAQQRQQRRAAAQQRRDEAAQRERDAAASPPPAPSEGGGCDPGYSPCVPPYPPDVNCPDVSGPVQVTGSDPHGLDRDGDGVACE